jgi:8-oxo-dGTP pyrophosphatase MutT (NUDIX family)
MAKTSYGVLLLNEKDELLIAHATGQGRWDIPKGGGEPGETPVAAALRELQEETGLTIAPERLTDLGDLPYRPGKRLHLFFARVDKSDYDLEGCVCSSFFPHYRTGHLVPEMDDFRWAHVSELPKLCGKALTALLMGLNVLQPSVRGGRVA